MEVYLIKFLKVNTESGRFYYTSFVENYYLGSNNTSIVKIKLKKKDILKVLQNHSKEIEKYVAANKLDYDNESSVIKILKYYTSL